MQFERNINEMKTLVSNILGHDSELFSLYSQKMLETEKESRSINPSGVHHFIEQYTQVNPTLYF
jgi:hypothetical protein